MKKLLSILLVLSIICSSYQTVFASSEYQSMFNSAIGIMNYSATLDASKNAREAKEQLQQQTALEQLNNKNKPSYFVQLKNLEGCLLSIDMSIVVACEFKKSYDKGWFEDTYKNVIVFRDVFDNYYCSEQFSSQEQGEQELKRITNEYNNVLKEFYKIKDNQ